MVGGVVDHFVTLHWVSIDSLFPSIYEVENSSFGKENIRPGSLGLDSELSGTFLGSGVNSCYHLCNTKLLITKIISS
jgi:hypothetical protein